MTRQEKNTEIYVAFDDYEPFDPSAPEKSLLRAILITALADLRKSGDVARKAREYFLNREDDYIFSFTSVCSYLKVDPKKVLMLTGLRGPAPQRVRTRGDSTPTTGEPTL